MTTTDRPRKRHAAHRSRWASAGLAAASTIGITGYLQFVQPSTVANQVVPTTDTLSTIGTGFNTGTASGIAPIPVPAPPAPITKIAIVDRQPPFPSATASPRPALPAPVVRPRVVQAPAVRAPVVHATTRGSGG